MSSQVIHVSQSTFEAEVLKADVPVVLDFWAPWCGPCRSIGPILDELSATYEGKVKVAKINVDNEPELATMFKVQGIPMLVAVEQGHVVHNSVGFGGRQPLEVLFEKLAAGEMTHLAHAHGGEEHSH